MLHLSCCQVDLERNRVHHANGDAVGLRSLPASLLRYLAARPYRVVPYTELLDQLWQEGSGSRSSLRNQLSRLRKAIGESARAPRHLFTDHGDGIRFVPAVVEAPQADGPAALHGRADALENLGLALAEARLVVIVGPGGVGKTRLAEHFAALQPSWQPLRVPLAAERAADRIAPAIQAALQLPAHPALSDERLAGVLRSRGPTLLLLDNLEQLAPFPPPSIAGLLGACPELSILATSQRPLGLDEEILLALAPLDDEAISAVFRDAAPRRGPPLPEPLPQPLLDALGGNPQCARLAAGQLELLALPALIERLPALLRFSDPDPTTPARQRSLASMLRWSLELATAEEQQALRCWAELHGPFEVDTAEALLPEPQRPETLGLLGRLARRGLIERTFGAVPRFSLRLPLRTLLRRTPAPAARARASAWWRRRCGDWLERHSRLGTLPWGTLQAALPDLEATFEEGDWTVGRLLGLALVSAGPVALTRHSHRLLSLPDLSPLQRAEALRLHGLALREGPRPSEALAIWDEALAIWDEGLAVWDETQPLQPSNGDLRPPLQPPGLLCPRLLRPRLLRPRLLGHRAVSHWKRGAIDEALADLEQALKLLGLADPGPARHHLAWQLHHDRGCLLRDQRHSERARADFETALRHATAIDSPVCRATCLGNLGILEAQRGRHTLAADFYRRELALLDEAEAAHRPQRAACLANLAVHHKETGALDRARAEFEEAARLQRALGRPDAEAIALDNLGTLALEQGDGAAGRDFLLAAIDRNTLAGARFHLAINHINLIACRLFEQRYGEARRAAQRALALAAEVGDPRLTAYARIWQACGVALAGGPGAAVGAEALLAQARAALQTAPDPEAAALAERAAGLVGFARWQADPEALEALLDARAAAQPRPGAGSDQRLLRLLLERALAATR